MHESAPRNAREDLQRFYSAFPGRWPGLALLLLRGVFGGAMVIQAKCCWSHAGAGSAALMLAGVAFLAGVLLFAGFLTPAVGGVIALGGLAIGLGWLPACSAALFDSKLSVAFGATILLATIVLGPGAFSVDARLFGRREIIIPRAPSAD